MLSYPLSLLMKLSVVLMESGGLHVISNLGDVYDDHFDFLVEIAMHEDNGFVH